LDRERQIALYKKISVLGVALSLVAALLMVASYTTYGLLVMLLGAILFGYTGGYLDAYRDIKNDQ
jgi:hypothetical protein